MRISCFYKSLLGALVWVSEPFKCRPALSAGKCDNFELMTSFDPLERVAGGQNLHPIEFIYTPTNTQNFVFLRGPGTEIAGRGASGAPPPARFRTFQCPPGIGLTQTPRHLLANAAAADDAVYGWLGSPPRHGSVVPLSNSLARMSRSGRSKDFMNKKIC